MKIRLAITVDDQQTMYEAIANLNADQGGAVDPVTLQWMLYGMLTDATLKLRLVPIDNGQGGGGVGAQPNVKQHPMEGAAPQPLKAAPSLLMKAPEVIL